MALIYYYQRIRIFVILRECLSGIMGFYYYCVRLVMIMRRDLVLLMGGIRFGVNADVIILRWSFVFTLIYFYEAQTNLKIF